jgi:hypothetical protein
MRFSVHLPWLLRQRHEAAIAEGTKLLQLHCYRTALHKKGSTQKRARVGGIYCWKRWWQRRWPKGAVVAAVPVLIVAAGV